MNRTSLDATWNTHRAADTSGSLPLRVLHVIASMARRSGGPPVTVRDASAALSRHGHRIDIATIDGYGPLIDLSTLEGTSVRLLVFPPSPPRALEASMSLLRFLKRHVRDYDVVIIHALYLFHTLAAGRMCGAAGVPYLIQPHGSLSPYAYGRHRWRKGLIEILAQNEVFRRAAGFLFTCEIERELAAPYVFARPGFVVKPILDLEAFRPVADGARPPHRHPVILYLGRINFKKGVDLLLRAYAMLKARDIRTRLVLAGPIDPDMAIVIDRISAELSITGEIEFPGLLAGEALVRAYQEATVYALPSYAENFGITILEAIAAGTPVVISDQVNIHREIAKAGVGIVVPCETAQVAEALASIIVDKDLRERLRAACGPFIDAYSRSSQGSGGLEAVLHEVCGRTATVCANRSIRAA